MEKVKEYVINKLICRSCHIGFCVLMCLCACISPFTGFSKTICSGIIGIAASVASKKTMKMYNTDGVTIMATLISMCLPIIWMTIPNKIICLVITVVFCAYYVVISPSLAEIMYYSKKQVDDTEITIEDLNSINELQNEALNLADRINKLDECLSKEDSRLTDFYEYADFLFSISDEYKSIIKKFEDIRANEEEYNEEEEKEAITKAFGKWYEEHMTIHKENINAIKKDMDECSSKLNEIKEEIGLKLENYSKKE